MGKALRFALSAVLAAVIVVCLMTGVLWGFGLLDRPEDDLGAQPVEILSESSRLDVAELLEGPEGRTLPKLPPMEEIPRMEVAPRAKTGFVQIEFEVGEDGVVHNAEVVNAVPAGVYEAQALEQVRNRRWAPDPRGQRTLTEVVRFSVPADAGADQPADTSGLRE